MKFTRHFKDFVKSESSSGIVLIAVTALTLLFANFVFHEQFEEFWKSPLLGKPLDFWVNDVLMTIFFLMVGLEIEREVYIGELANIKQAMLPIIAAFGGMLAPALIYIGFNASTGSISGFGIPTATDIAFSITVLTIVASRVPTSLKIFLTALAIIDDIGAIIIIAIFYTKDFSIMYLGFAIAIFAFLLLLNRKGVHNLLFYFIPGIAAWFCLYKAGVHPTITGVLLAFVIPFGNGDEKSPSYKIQLYLHRPVAFIILPIFAIANTGIVINSADFPYLLSVNSLGIILGLVLGKPIGITLICWAAIKLKFCKMFEGITLKHILGAGMVAGIGFTMSIFITLLAFEDAEMIKTSKISIVLASTISAVIGLIFISLTNKRKAQQEIEEEIKEFDSDN